MKVATEQLLASVKNLDASQVQDHVIEYRSEVICKLIESVKVFGNGRIELGMKFRDILLTDTIG